MKANELKLNDVLAINSGAMHPDRYVRITSEVAPGVGSIAGHATGHDLGSSLPSVIAEDSDSHSANGSPIGSWKRLDAEYAAVLIAEYESHDCAKSDEPVDLTGATRCVVCGKDVLV